MNRRVRLTLTAKRQLEQLLKYLLEEWSEKAKQDFIEKLDERIDHIKERPNLFPKSHIKKDLHKCVVTKHSTIYYLHDLETITILGIFDNRQDPDILKNQIEKDET